MDFFNECNDAVTICDTEGIIIYMNKKSILTFEKYGGEKLIGQSLMDCHPEPARSKLIQMLKDHQANTYTIEKGDIKKLIHQLPWFTEGIFKGIIEISIEIPKDMPHYIRS